MQSQPPEEKSLIRLSSLGSDINQKAREAIQLASESVRNGNAAVIAAIECGKLLVRARSLCKKGEWEKWLSDNCGDISYETAQRWVRLSKVSHVTDLENCSSMRKAYIACGILPEPTAKAHGIGTADVDLFASFVASIVREAGRIERITEGVDLRDMPEDNKAEVRAAIERIKMIEGKL